MSHLDYKDLEKRMDIGTYNTSLSDYQMAAVGDFIKLLANYFDDFTGDLGGETKVPRNLHERISLRRKVIHAKKLILDKYSKHLSKEEIFHALKTFPLS